jgi:hypothetical protein
MLDDPKGLKPIASYGAAARETKLTQAITMASERNQKFSTMAPDDSGKLVPKEMTIKEMYDAFMSRPSTAVTFNSGDAVDLYATTSVKEFFAEAFAAFHSGDEVQQALLLKQAPEAYFFFEGLAKKTGVAYPDVDHLRTVKTP